jgi:enolase
LPLYRYVGGVSVRCQFNDEYRVVDHILMRQSRFKIHDYASKATSFTHAMQIWELKIFHEKKYYDRGLSTAVGDEGGFAPNLAGGPKTLWYY